MDHYLVKDKIRVKLQKQTGAKAEILIEYDISKMTIISCDMISWSLRLYFKSTCPDGTDSLYENWEM